jgi:hypothetical protein
MLATGIRESFEHLDQGMQMGLGQQVLAFFFCKRRKDATCRDTIH